MMLLIYRVFYSVT